MRKPQLKDVSNIGALIIRTGIGCWSIFTTYNGTKIPALITTYSEPSAGGLWLQTQNQSWGPFGQGLTNTCPVDFVRACSARRFGFQLNHEARMRLQLAFDIIILQLRISLQLGLGKDRRIRD